VDKATNEEVPSMIPVMRDYNVMTASPAGFSENPDDQPPAAPKSLEQKGPDGRVHPSFRVYLKADGTYLPGNPAQSLGFLDDGYSPIVDPNGNPTPYVLTVPKDIRYHLDCQILGSTQTSKLLATPYFDDITLFFDTGGVQYLQVWFEETSQ
jgi:hypothetical protein